jgi:hypothetical protein
MVGRPSPVVRSELVEDETEVLSDSPRPAHNYGAIWQEERFPCSKASVIQTEDLCGFSSLGEGNQPRPIDDPVVVRCRINRESIHLTVLTWPFPTSPKHKLEFSLAEILHWAIPGICRID